MSAESTGTEAARAAAAWPAPGAVLGRGRYRLVDEVGVDDRCDARLWRGRDAVLERDVALTLFVADSGDSGAVSNIRVAVQQSLRAARLETVGAARVLDVLEPETGPGPTVAAVVAEWTPGRDLVELVRDGLPAPSVAASMLAPLAGAVDDAHRAGLVLGTDHPQRIRVTPEGHARLAFPGPAAGAHSQDDVQGLGAVLYLVLTGRWALPGGPDELPSAPRGPEGNVLSPRSLRPAVPQDLSTLAVRSLAGSSAGGVHTGAAVQRVLERSAAIGDRALLPAQGGAAGADPVWHGPEEEEPPRSDRRRKLGIAVAGLVVATLLIIGWLGVQITSVFTGDTGNPPAVVIDGQQPGAAPAPAPPASPPAGPVAIEDVAVYDDLGDGDPDNPDDVGLAVDGDPATTWATDSYVEQFPAYKPGVGLMITLPEATALSSVAISSPSVGTVVEIRAAPSDDADFEETTAIGTATLREGVTEIPLAAAEPTEYVVVWITQLGDAGGESASEIGEVALQRAG